MTFAADTFRKSGEPGTKAAPVSTEPVGDGEMVIDGRTFYMALSADLNGDVTKTPLQDTYIDNLEIDESYLHGSLDAAISEMSDAVRRANDDEDNYWRSAVIFEVRAVRLVRMADVTVDHIAKARGESDETVTDKIAD